MSRLARPAIGHMPFPKHRPCNQWGPEIDLELFLEAVAKGRSINQAARSVGQSEQWGRHQFALIAESMGEAA